MQTLSLTGDKSSPNMDAFRGSETNKSCSGVEITPHQAASKTHHKNDTTLRVTAFIDPGFLPLFTALTALHVLRLSAAGGSPITWHGCRLPDPSVYVTGSAWLMPHRSWPSISSPSHAPPFAPLSHTPLSFPLLSLCFSLQHICKHITAHIDTHMHTLSLFPLPFSLRIFWNELNAELGQNIKRWRCESWRLSEV